MKREDMLARLMAQENAEGGDLITLRAIVEEASELGAVRMLARMGLNDDGAPDDLSELRELLRAWRDAKRSMWKAVIDWAVRAIMAALLVGIAMRSGAGELLK
jgi:hypothetical protein